MRGGDVIQFGAVLGPDLCSEVVGDGFEHFVSHVATDHCIQLLVLQLVLQGVLQLVQGALALVNELGHHRSPCRMGRRGELDMLQPAAL
jgi:hypothetical protein